MTSAISLQAELQAAFDAKSPAAFRVTRCEHCGEAGAGGETHCDCTELIAKFGACGCATCGITYAIRESVMAYIDNCKEAGYDDPEFKAYMFYKAGLGRLAPYCGECSAVYSEYYGQMWEEWTSFQNSYEQRNFWKLVELGILDEPDYDYDNYDEPCRSGSGGICPCCGD